MKDISESRVCWVAALLGAVLLTGLSLPLVWTAAEGLGGSASAWWWGGLLEIFSNAVGSSPALRLKLMKAGWDYGELPGVVLGTVLGLAAMIALGGAIGFLLGRVIEMLAGSRWRMARADAAVSPLVQQVGRMGRLVVGVLGVSVAYPAGLVVGLLVGLLAGKTAEGITSRYLPRSEIVEQAVWMVYLLGNIAGLLGTTIVVVRRLLLDSYRVKQWLVGLDSRGVLYKAPASNA